MEKKEKTDLLSYIREGRAMKQSEKLRLIVNMSIPSILAQISSTIMFFIDASMVGHLGARQSAAIGLIESTSGLFMGLVSAASLGFSVQVAHFIGANDFVNARRVLRQSLVCCSVWSLLLLSISVGISPFLPYWLGGSADIAPEATLYFAIFGAATPFFQLESLAGSMLKSSGNMKIPSLLNIMMCVLDVCFNYFFIFVIGLGVLGAALGSLIAFVITAVCMLWFLLIRSKELSIIGRNDEDGGNRWHIFSPQRTTIETAFKIGAPMGFQHLLMGSAQIVSTMIVAPLGTIAIAANSLAITVESLCYMPGYGIAEAATTLVGQGIGAGQRLLTLSLAYLSVGLGITTMTLMGVLMYVFAPELMAIMTPVEAIIHEGTQALRIEAWAEPMFAATIVCNGIFIGAGDTLIPAIMSLSSMWCVRLTLASFLAPRLGLKGVWTAMAIDLMFRGIIFLARLLRGKWVKEKIIRPAAILLALLSLPSVCEAQQQKVLLETTEGNICIALSDETPIHRDNFLHLVETHFYDSLLFHRVIRNFMVQCGDPNSRHAEPGAFLGEGSADYTLEPEIRIPTLYHRRGMVVMAREGDDVNPQRRSSGSHFYIVWGKTYSSKDLEAIQQHLDTITSPPTLLTPEMIQAYRKTGGTPHLDGQYTVFGEVVEGLEVVDRIQRAMTDDYDRPVDDVRILRATIIRAASSGASLSPRM